MRWHTLEEKLIEESIVGRAVCLAFCCIAQFAGGHHGAARRGPDFVRRHVWQGLSSKHMSLGGIAIGHRPAMVDAVIIMIENAHKHLERDAGKKPHGTSSATAAVRGGADAFYSLLVITVSFIPVFTLQAQEGRLFKPLAFTKTYSMAAAARCFDHARAGAHGLGSSAATCRPRKKNPLNRLLIWLYHPAH